MRVGVRRHEEAETAFVAGGLENDGGEGRAHGGRGSILRRAKGKRGFGRDESRAERSLSVGDPLVRYDGKNALADFPDNEVGFREEAHPAISLSE
jgi:hypothetical protein